MNINYNLGLEELAAVIITTVLVLIIIIFIIVKTIWRPKKDFFMNEWKKLQQRCSDKSQWPTAIVEADELLDKALKKRKVKGKTMGERLVSAQKVFSDNDGAWYGHKLRKKLEEQPSTVLRKDDVKRALLGLGQALKDLEVL